MKKLNSYETLVDVIEIRENHYEKYLGKLDQPILSPTEKIYPHIEIYQIAPTPQRPYWTLITNGMSDAKQNIPLDNNRISGRTELFMYVVEPQEWMFKLLGGLALEPFANQYFVHWEHLYCLDDNIIPKETGISNVLFLLPFYEDERFCNTLYIDGDKVDPLWVFPITGQEFEQCQQDKCARRVVENLMQIGHPRIFDIIS
ncbi:MAG: suppressor of fused domain protein [Lentisphaerota bacterium]